ncbi:MAG: type II toxin-antitoxin system PemK/MazF family toxin [Elusimicrobiota bacterium]
MRRGEIWWGLVKPKTRPFVLVSRDSHLEKREWILAAPVTARMRLLESQVFLGPEDGMTKPCVADAGSLVTIKKTQLIRRIASLSPAKRDALDAALRFSLGLD